MNVPGKNVVYIKPEKVKKKNTGGLGNQRIKMMSEGILKPLSASLPEHTTYASVMTRRVHVYFAVMHWPLSLSVKYVCFFIGPNFSDLSFHLVKLL